MAYKPVAGPQMSSPNVIPMADIMLVLLIIFMVVTPMLQKGVSVDMASVNDPRDMQDADKDDAIIVAVTRDGTLYLGNTKINNEDTTWETLGPRMEQIFKERAEKVAFVKGDNDVLFMDVARAIDIMKGAGIDKVGLITAKLEAGQ